MSAFCRPRLRRLALTVFALLAFGACTRTGIAAGLSDPPPLAGSTGSEVRPRDPQASGALELSLHKLRVLGSVLYIAAHPDDENTALLTYLSNGRLARAGYLSLTRGDGGQNLLGTEIGEQLGVIRTQELLAARRIDGAEQYFSRALDFGFSKGPDETLQIWGHDAILSDVVWVIRNFRPDVIVTRFATDGSGGHGHHTASAMLAEEAFHAAADSTRFPEQLAFVRPWQAKRIVWNVTRFDPSKPAPRGPQYVTTDLGGFNPLLGRAYTEIAGESRSQHKSQGFGAPERRGPAPNFFELRGGDSAHVELLDGVNTTWSRIPGGSRVDALLAQAEREFRPDAPERSIPLLLRAHAAMRALGGDPWVALKRRNLEEVVRSCAGLWLEAIAATPAASPGGSVKVSCTALARSSFAMSLERIELPNGAAVSWSALAGDSGTTGGATAAHVLPPNRAVTGEATIALPVDAAISQPYWLRSPASKGRFDVRDPQLIGRAENPPALAARFVIRAGDEELTYERPIVQRWVDPVLGERYRPFEVVPAATLKLDHAVYVFPSRDAREVRVTMQAADAAMSGTVRLALPAGWKAAPDAAPVEVPKAGERTVTFRVTPPVAASDVAPSLAATFTSGGQRFDRRLVRIDYPHIPIQTLFPPAQAKLVRADAQVLAHEIGYVMGSGDQVPDALAQLGCHVTMLGDDDLERLEPGRFDAIVIGVRAYNTRPRLRVLQPKLLDYANAGGTLVVQYQTPDDALDGRIGPYPFTVSRDRVTVEEAPVRFLVPGHALLQRPNRITAADFGDWVQERGLSFANPYDPKYQTVLSSNDPGEPARDGGLLYAPWGKGVYIYTGYAWFRQLPAGVPGAYRLIANLVSAGR